LNIEREIKLRLERDAEPRLSALAPYRRNVASIYYDTPRQELRRAGVALRLRRDGGRWLQTLKAESAQHAGLAARTEWELPVRRKALEPDAFPLDEIRCSTGVDLARLAGRLRPVFETRFTRRSGLVQLDGAGKAELAVDRGSIVTGRRREAIYEAELELISGDPAALLRFAEGLELPLAYESKAERGYRLAAGMPPGPRKWRMPELEPAGPADAAFAALFSAALAQAGINAGGMPGSTDPEYLHQLRVGLRRLRAALRAFAPVVKDDKPLRKALRALTPALGAARDWDVFVQTLADAGAGARLLRSARQERNRVRRAALETMSSREFHGFLFRSLRWVQSRPSPQAATLSDLAPERLERLHRNALADLASATPKRRHKLRIRIKRLRYACEFFAPCFASAVTGPYLRRLARLQDLLGELNDIAVARRLLKDMDAAAPPRLEMGEKRREKRLIASFRAAWTRFQAEPPYWRRPG
jgi:inorganic triphosphatase YgiF